MATATSKNRHRKESSPVQTDATLLQATAALAAGDSTTLANIAARLLSAGAVSAANLLASVLAVLGATNGVAVVTDADGTVQQYLRGLIKVFASVWDSTQNGLRIADLANIADYANIQQAEAGAVILDTNWHQVSTGDLTIGMRYELQLYSTIPSDVGILRWVTKAAVGDPGAVIGRLAFLHSPIIVVPKVGHVRLYVKTVTDPTTYGNNTGYYAALEPCE